MCSDPPFSLAFSATGLSIRLPRSRQRVEKLLRAHMCHRFEGRIGRLRNVLDVFSGTLGEPTGPTTTFSTGWRILRSPYPPSCMA
jgi:hypothetical protein